METGKETDTTGRGKCTTIFGQGSGTTCSGLMSEWP